MRITAIEEYGLRCLVALARLGPDEQASITEIAEMEGLSVAYTSKLLSILRKKGLVTAIRGRGGGFTIALPLNQISLYDVLVALGGPLIDPHHCEKRSGQLEQCVHLKSCSVQDVLGGLAGYIQEFLTDTSLQDIAFGLPSGFIQRAKNQIIIANTALKKELQNVNEGDSGA
ncbi:MAG: Rrf2 family transcriptional regulator [candidate division Zixibacteria bacterium]|nr:Rrf2 family transcriptional regulator [candidate division Zixibacteria bacterium]